MIWQLIKRDPIWKPARAAVGGTLIGMLVALVIVAAFGVLPTLLKRILAEPAILGKALVFVSGFGALFGIWFVVCLVFTVHSQRALYEAALPIAGRDLWLSRVFLLLTLIWLPLLPPILIAVAFGIQPAPLLQAAAIYTLLVLTAKCIRIRSIGPPNWLGMVGFLAPLLAMSSTTVFIPHLKSASWFALPPTGIVLTICGLGSAALFWWGWTNVPKSFQLASPELAPIRTSETKEPSQFISSPLFRSLYGRSTVMLLVSVFLIGNIMAGNAGFAGLLLGIMGSTLAEIRLKCRWLLTLPISPRKLFGWATLPLAAAIVAGSFAGIFIGIKRPLSEARLVMIAELAGLYGLIFLSELPAWRRLSKLRTIRWGVQTLWAPFVIATIALLFDLPNAAFPGLADRLPGRWQLVAVLAVPLTYWLAEKAFREQEYRASLIELNAHRRNTI